MGYSVDAKYKQEILSMAPSNSLIVTAIHIRFLLLDNIPWIILL